MMSWFLDLPQLSLNTFPDRKDFFVGWVDTHTYEGTAVITNYVRSWHCPSCFPPLTASQRQAVQICSLGHFTDDKTESSRSWGAVPKPHSRPWWRQDQNTEARSPESTQCSAEVQKEQAPAEKRPGWGVHAGPHQLVLGAHRRSSGFQATGDTRACHLCTSWTEGVTAPETRGCPAGRSLRTWELGRKALASL